MAVNYKAYEFQLYEIVGQLLKLLPPAERGALPMRWQDDLAQLRRSLEDKRFRVAVVGEMKRGKTSFVNALMGQELLPADYMPATAANNRITYGDQIRAYVLMKSGEKQFVQVEKLADYVTKRTQESARMAAQVEEAVVEFPSLLCHNDVDIIDTPGMNDEEDMNQITISRLENIDLAIVAVTAGAPFSITEASFTLQLLENPQICQIIFVITKMDMVRPSERRKLIDFMPGRIRDSVWERIEGMYEPDSEIVEKYHALLDEPIIFPVCALDALDARSNNDMELYKASGFAALNEELPRIILSSQNSSTILNTERKIRDILRQYRQWAADAPENRTRLQAAAAGLEKYSRAAAQGRFPSNLPTLPSASGEAVAMRQKFINALTAQRTPSYEALRLLFVPVMKSCFQEQNAHFSMMQKQAMDGWESGSLRLAAEDMRDHWSKALAPWPEVLQAVSEDLDQVCGLFQYAKSNDPVEQFRWIVNPLPDQESLKKSWNGMLHVDNAIRVSMEDYLQRRNRQLEDIRRRSQNQLDQGIEHLIGTLRSACASQIGRLEDQREQAALRIEALAKECGALKDRFLAELKGKSQAPKSRVGIMGVKSCGLKTLVDALLGEAVLTTAPTVPWRDCVVTAGPKTSFQYSKALSEPLPGVPSPAGGVDDPIRLELSGSWDLCRWADLEVYGAFTDGRLADMDAVAVVLRADGALPDHIMERCRQLRQAGVDLLFVLNKMDLVSEEAREHCVELFRPIIQHKLEDLPVSLFPVSAREALEGRLTGNAEKIRRSGIEALEKAIRYLTGKD